MMSSGETPPIPVPMHSPDWIDTSFEVEERRGCCGCRRRSKPGKEDPLSRTVIKLKAIEKDITKDDKNMPWIHTAQAEAIFGGVVFMNAIWIGIDIEFSTGGFNWGFWCTESAFLVVFIIEILMRVRAETMLEDGRWYYYFNKSGLFDFFIVAFGCLDAWVLTILQATAGDEGGDSPFSSLTVLRVFRLIRLVRLVRVLRMFGELVVLIQTLSGSIKAVGWMSLLLFMILYASSIFTVLQIGETSDKDDSQKFYGDLGKALFSHFCIVCLEGWCAIADAARQESALWGLYFVFLVILTNFALVNLMVGVIVERIIHHSLEQENDLSAFVAESQQFHKTLETLFASGDLDQSGDVSVQEVRELLEDQRTREIMSAFGINLNIPATTLHTIMKLNIQGDSLTTFEHFVGSCMRLCGSKQSGHWIFVQYDICECQEDLGKRLEVLEKQLAQVGTKVHRQLQEACAPPSMVVGAGFYGGSRSGFANSAAVPPFLGSFGAPSPGGSGTAPVVVPLPLKLTGLERDTLGDLNNQMDDLGKMQKLVLNELESVKAQRAAKLANGMAPSRGGSGSRRPSRSERGSPGRTVELAARPPKDIGSCCTLGAMWAPKAEK